MLKSERLLRSLVFKDFPKLLNVTSVNGHSCLKCSNKRNLHILHQGNRYVSKGVNGSQGLPIRRYCEGQPAEARKITPAADIQSRILHFDTLQLFNKCQEKGFTAEQASCIVESFVEVLNNNIEHQTKIMVTKAQQEITVQQLMAHIGSVKKDMVILEKSEFSMLRNETEKNSLQLKQNEQIIKDEVMKLKNHMALDMNLERSRSMEAHQANEKNLHHLSQKVDTEVASINAKLENHKSLLDTEVAKIQTKIESDKNDRIKWGIGLLTSSVALGIGVLRLFPANK